MNLRCPLSTVCAATLGLTLAAAQIHANTILSRRELLSFRTAVALPGVQLTPGTYVLELADPSVANVVRVRDRTSNRVEFTGFTYRINRPAGRKDSQVVVGEGRQGEPAPVLAWYPTGQELGYKFIYRDGR